MGSIRDQVVRRPEAGSPSRHMGPDPDPAPTNDVAREYLADPLTRARGPAGSPRTACVSDRAPSRRRYIQRGRTGSQSAVDGRHSRRQYGAATIMNRKERRKAESIKRKMRAMKPAARELAIQTGMELHDALAEKR